MSVKIISDSACDLPVAQDGALRILPMKISFGEDIFLDGVDLSHSMFYEKLIECSSLPTTSLIPPYEFEQAFAQVAAAGDTAVAVTLSQKLSGTYQSAVIAAQPYEGSVVVVDSQSVSVGQKILVCYAQRLAEAGLDARVIADKLEAEKRRVCVLALLDTLEYLKAGGRISKTVAFAGEMFHIKPVVALRDGEVALIGKARGSKNSNNLLKELIRAKGGIDFDYPVALGYTGLNDNMLQKYIADSRELWQAHAETLPVGSIGGTIGTHAGPGAIAVAFFAR